MWLQYVLLGFAFHFPPVIFSGESSASTDPHSGTSTWQVDLRDAGFFPSCARSLVGFGFVKRFFPVPS